MTRPAPTPRGRTRGKAGRPREGKQVREKYDFRAEPSLVERVREKAEREGTTLSKAVVSALESWLRE